jgi:hypothetical protein
MLLKIVLLSKRSKICLKFIHWTLFTFLEFILCPNDRNNITMLQDAEKDIHASRKLERQNIFNPYLYTFNLPSKRFTDQKASGN